MVDRGGQPPLTEKSGPVPRRVQLPAEYLERDAPARILLFGFIDHAHAAPAQQSQNAIGSERFPDIR